MKIMKKIRNIQDDKVKLKNITDYLTGTIWRIKEHMDFLTYLYENKKILKKHQSLVLSLIDVYSRNIITEINTILDKDSNTSSVFTLMSYLSEKDNAKFYKIFTLINKQSNIIIQTRHNVISHYNTRVNSRNPYIMPLMLSPKYLRPIVDEVEKNIWKIKEKLNIEGIGGFIRGVYLITAFEELIKKPNKKTS